MPPPTFFGARNEVLVESHKETYLRLRVLANHRLTPGHGRALSKTEECVYVVVIPVKYLT